MILGFASTYFVIHHGQNQPQEDVVAVQTQAQEKANADSLFRYEVNAVSKNDRKSQIADFYMPQYKDADGVCGIATNKYDEHVAIVSDGACPTNEALSVNYGYTYESLTDTYRPTGDGNSCGTAHLVTEDVRIGATDMAKLTAITQGDLENVGVSPKGLLCPTQAELSDDVSNSVGVPVRFEYNNFNTNVNNYPVFNVSSSDYRQEILLSDNDDVSIANNLSGTKVKASNGKYIPKIMLMPEAKQHCGGNFGLCSFNEDRMSLTNADGEEYFTKTGNEEILPKFMMTKGAWDVCGGIFTQCDYTPDEENPEYRGTVVNRLTHKSYTSKLPVTLVADD